MGRRNDPGTSDFARIQQYGPRIIDDRDGMEEFAKLRWLLCFVQLQMG